MKTEQTLRSHGSCSRSIKRSQPSERLAADWKAQRSYLTYPGGQQKQPWGRIQMHTKETKLRGILPQEFYPEHRTCRIWTVKTFELTNSRPGRKIVCTLLWTECHSRPVMICLHRHHRRNGFRGCFHRCVSTVVNCMEDIHPCPEAALLRRTLLTVVLWGCCDSEVT